jgi:hypothetical protein
VVILAVAWFVDTAMAANSERKLSNLVEAQAHLEYAPEVYIGGMPFLGNLYTGVVPEVRVAAADVEVSPFGLLGIQTSLVDVEATSEQLLNGDFSGSKAALVTRGVTFDPVALGRQLHMPDLDIAHPYDISPAGSSASEVILTGTLRDETTPVTVFAELRLKGPLFQLTPTVVLDRGESHASEEKILESFAWQIDTRQLPLPKQASYVSGDSGTIYFESQEVNVTVDITDLTPISD